MSIRTVLQVVLLVFVCRLGALGQERLGGPALKRAIVFRTDQDAIRGQILNLDEASMTLLTSEREVTIPLVDIRRVIVTYERSAGRGAVIGAALAGYTTACVFMTSRDAGGFVTTGDGGFLFLIPGIAVGAALGYLVDPGSGLQEMIFDLTGDEGSQSRERERLIQECMEEAHSGGFRITLQASHVYPQLPRLSVPGEFGAYSERGISEFNILRRVQVTYSLSTVVDVGLAQVWFDEPPRTTSGYTTLTNGDSKGYTVTQKLEASGTCAVASIRPLGAFALSNVDLAIGGGMGIGSLEFNRTAYVSNYPLSGIASMQPYSFKVSEHVVFGYLFAHYATEIVTGFSLGIVADVVIGPSEAAPSFVEATIPAQTLQFGNSSLGFVMSLRF